LRVRVVHLVWGPLGVSYLQRFIDSYTAHAAGYPHDLVVILNNVDAATHLAAQRALSDVAHVTWRPTRPVMDLEAYRLVMDELPADVFCFFNSYSRILGSAWLAHYVMALQAPGVGLVGAGASYRSVREFNPWRARGAPLPYLKRVARDVAAARRALKVRIAFAAPPAPFVRTNGFAIATTTRHMLAWPPCGSKWDTWKLEMGKRGLTAQARALGLRPVVIDRWGHIFDLEEWPGSGTYWSGDQEGLLVADNRSDEYLQASAHSRPRLERVNWCRAPDEALS
jgi:hypothetical protein